MDRETGNKHRQFLKQFTMESPLTLPHPSQVCTQEKSKHASTSNKDMYANTHDSVTHSSQKVETAQVSTS